MSVGVLVPSPFKKLKKSGETIDADDFDADTQKALEEIDVCQSEIDTINEKASEEILLVERRYNKLRKPFFESRNVLIEKIPNFWVTAFINHPQVATILEEDEEDCLHYLTKVDVEESEDIKSGYSIRFHFKENPFFSNSTLLKTFKLAGEVEHGGPVSQSTPIEWKEGQTLDKAVSAGKKGRLHRTFFRWFLDNRDPAADDIAEVIKDEMWPNPLQFFLAPDIEVEENGVNSEDEEEEDGDDSVIVLAEDDVTDVTVITD